MPDTWIHVDNQYLSLEDIRTGNYSANENSFKKTLLDFCNEWLNGREKFKITTSGSTGAPKEIHLFRTQMQASALATAKALDLQPGFTALVCLDVQYIGGMMMLVRSLETGMNMIVVEPTGNPVERLPFETSIDFAAMVPLQLESILKSPHREKLNQFGVVLIGGAALHSNTVVDIQNLSCRFFATYGMTETLSHIALQQLNGSGVQDYFQALPGIELRQDERGCLIIKADYLGQDPIFTNDIVEYLPPDKFRWLGRADTIINTGGVKVIPEKIEAEINLVWSELKLSNRFFIAAMPDTLLGESVNLFIEGAPLQSDSETKIHLKLKATLGKYERPKSIRYIPAFSTTPSGKINRPKSISSIVD